MEFIALYSAERDVRDSCYYIKYLRSFREDRIVPPPTAVCHEWIPSATLMPHWTAVGVRTHSVLEQAVLIMGHGGYSVAMVILRGLSRW